MERLRALFREPEMRQRATVEEAMGHQCLAMLRQVDAAADGGTDLEQALIAAFDSHPDAAILTSFPGMASVSGARVLGEIGDDRTRFADARGLKAYAGSAPITRASGKSMFISRRRVKNRRLFDAGYNWTLASLRVSPGARAHYDRRREQGDRHSAAQRNLYNRFLGMLFHCLQTGSPFDEASVFAPLVTDARIVVKTDLHQVHFTEPEDQLILSQSPELRQRSDANEDQKDVADLNSTVPHAMSR